MRCFLRSRTLFKQYVHGLRAKGLKPICSHDLEVTVVETKTEVKHVNTTHRSLDGQQSRAGRGAKRKIRTQP
jgi:hypothetical protein